jgi:hypothetical protein
MVGDGKNVLIRKKFDGRNFLLEYVGDQLLCVNHITWSMIEIILSADQTIG